MVINCQFIQLRGNLILRIEKKAKPTQTFLELLTIFIKVCARDLGAIRINFNMNKDVFSALI